MLLFKTSKLTFKCNVVLLQLAKEYCTFQSYSSIATACVNCTTQAVLLPGILLALSTVLKKGKSSYCARHMVEDGELKKRGMGVFTIPSGCMAAMKYPPEIPATVVISLVCTGTFSPVATCILENDKSRSLQEIP